MPSDAELVAQFGVSRMTVTRALNELRAEGLVERVQGAGTSAPHLFRVASTLRIRDLHEEITARGHQHHAEVQLARQPTEPDGHNDWYVTPVTVVVTATEMLGSGVAGVEVSTDGATWQPYTAPLVFSSDAPGATVYARATDAAGHVSDPISTTFKIDQTPPDSHVTGGVGPGALVAEVFTNLATRAPPPCGP